MNYIRLERKLIENSRIFSLKRDRLINKVALKCNLNPRNLHDKVTLHNLDRQLEILEINKGSRFQMDEIIKSINKYKRN